MIVKVAIGEAYVPPLSIEMKNEYVAKANLLWKEIHSEENPTPEWFTKWRARVKELSGCDCYDWLDGYVVTNPPRYNDWPKWTWELHNAVNAKLLKPEYSWDQFFPRWIPDHLIQSQIRGILLVTSLSPLESHHREFVR